MMKSRAEIMQMLATVAGPGWTVRGDVSPVVISANEARNPAFAPNVVMLAVEPGEVDFATLSTVLELSRSTDATGPIRSRQVIIDHGLDMPVATDIVHVDADDGLVQIAASAGPGDVDLVAQLMDAIVEAVLEGQLEGKSDV